MELTFFVNTLAFSELKKHMAHISESIDFKISFMNQDNFSFTVFNEGKMILVYNVTFNGGEYFFRVEQNANHEKELRKGLIRACIDTCLMATPFLDLKLISKIKIVHTNSN